MQKLSPTAPTGSMIHRMSILRVIQVAWLAGILGTARGAEELSRNTTPAPSAAREAADQASTAFFAGPILSFEVDLPPKSLQSLREDSRRSMPATVRVGGEIFDSVGVHVKGSAGSRRSIDGNAALTLSFGKFKPGQSFHGLKKIHLNNSAQDPSRMNELLAVDLYRRAGIPVTRATHGWVKINGSDFGLYVVKEGYDKVWLRRNFADPDGNLYDGGFLQDVDSDLERDEGSGPEDRKDLRALLAAAALRDVSGRREALDRLLDLDQFTTFCAIQNLLSDWDGYVYNHNNYRLYQEPRTGRFTFLPHGMDQLFGDTGFRLDRNMNGLVARQVNAIPGQRDRMYSRVEALLTNAFTKDAVLQVFTNALARLSPTLEQRGRAERRDLLGAINDTRQRALERLNSARQQLATRPKPFKFDAAGVAVVTGWVAAGDKQRTKSDVGPAPDGTSSLILETTGEGGAPSWRRQLRLPAGTYSFEARIRSEGVRARTEAQGRGIGLRLSRQSRTNSLENSSDWTVLAQSLEADGEQLQDLIVEMRADAGKMWIDQGSLRLRRSVGK